MPLKKLKVKTVTPPAAAGGMPTINIDGDLVKQYVDAANAKKRAEEVLEDLRPEVLEVGHGEIYRRSIESPVTPVLSVRLKDESSEELMVSFTSKYKEIADVIGLEALFDSLKNGDGTAVDINDFVQENIVVTFDNKALCDGEGRFMQERYDKFLKAVAKVAQQLDIPCPMATKKVTTTLPKLHQLRWQQFPDVAVQEKISQMCPNVTMIKTDIRSKDSAKRQ